MAKDTPAFYRQLVVYSVYVRNHGPNGTFADVEADLPRIRSMGADAVWFLPVHPIGTVKRKGALGSPYSISDFRGVNPEYGTRDDFARLIERAHGLGLKVFIDVVAHHTAHDSVLAREHYQFYHTDDHGRPVSTVPEWSDVIDLRHPHPGLTAVFIEALQEWARFGVDGFRCDVASLVPLAFWREVREALTHVKPGVVWIAESVHAAFVGQRRARGLSGVSDGELYSAFDILYGYDLWPVQQAAMTGRMPVGRYLEMLLFQDTTLPANAVKLRCTENHDQARTFRLVPDVHAAKAWIAFEAFNKGAFLIHAGQESAAVHTPSLFEKDPVDWNGYPLQGFLTRLAGLKKDPAQAEGRFLLLDAEPAIQAAWDNPGACLYGVFNVGSVKGSAAVQVPDGTYPDALGGGEVKVRDGRMDLPEDGVVIRVKECGPFREFTCDLMDYRFRQA